MAVPRKRRRVRLLIILSRQEDYYGVKMLSDIQPIFDKIEASQSLTTEEEDVALAVDSFYAAYDPTDEDINACTCSYISGETHGVKMDALESAINNL